VPSLDLRFADSKSLVDSRTGQSLVTFTRASSATYIDSAGTLRTAVTNLQRWSEDFTQGLTPNNATLTANQGIAPNGTLTADQFLETTTNGLHSQEIADHTFTAGVTYTFSCYAKTIGARNFGPGFPTLFGSARFGFFDLTGSGSVVSTNAGVTASIQAVGDGWYRCSITSTCVTGGGARVGVFIASGTSISYAGDITKGLLLWGAQLEQASTVGEYIPTTSAINSAPRFDHAITSSRTNHIRNNTMVGAVAGTPGTLPTNWSFSGAGSNIEVVGTGSENDINYIDVRFSGTATNTNLNFESTTLASASQVWAASSYFKLISGTFTGNWRLTCNEFASGGGFLRTGLAQTFTPTNAGLSTQRVAGSFTTGVSTATISVLLNCLSSTTPIDFTLRIGLPQLEQGSVATSAIPTSTAAVTVNTTESLGLLVEDQRTNSIRNNTMVGAVAGTPGTSPTNWTLGSLSGLTQTIVGTGTESGIAYIDIRIFGTTSSALFFGVRPENITVVAATPNSIWTSTFYVRLVGGSLTNVTGIKNVLTNFNSSGAALNQYAVALLTPTSAALATQRYSLSTTSATFADATTAFVISALQVEANSGAAIDITLRIGLPQLEQGAFATSVIPTTTAAATRAADVASITGSNFGTTRTNLLLRSEAIATSPWFAGANTTLTNNTSEVLDPAGGSTATKVLVSGGTGAFGQGATLTAAIHTGSIWLRCSTGTISASLIVYLSGSPFTNIGTANVTITTFWQRFTVVTSTATAAAYNLQLNNIAVGTVYAWGAQLEVGSAVTPYIPTTTAAVSVFESSWYRQNEGTVFYDGTVSQGLAGFPWFYNISDGTVNNSIGVYQFTNGIYGGTQAGGVAATPDPSVLFSPVPGSTAKHALAVKALDTRAALNSTLSSAQLSTVMPVVNTLSIGQRVTGNRMTGTIKRLTYWPQRLPNSTLQAITQ
jgi:hypothetical protein